MEKALRLGLHLVECHGFHQGVAPVDIVDAEILLLQAQQLAGNRRIAGKPQRIGAREIGLGLGEFP